MKLEGKKYWKIRNVGYPNDTEDGEGDAKALAFSLVTFWQRVTMGSKIVIEIHRDIMSRDGVDKDEQDTQELIDSMFAGLDYSKAVD